MHLSSVFMIIFLLLLSAHTHSDDILPIVTVEFPPFGYADPDSQPSGASTEIVEETVIRMGYISVIDILPSKRAQQMTASGSYIAIFPVTKSMERAEYCLFSEPISYISDVFFKRKKDSISWEQLGDIGNYIVGATDGYNYAQVFLEAIRQGQLKVDFIASEKPELQHLKKLVKGRIDLAICERSVCSYLLKKHRSELSALDFIPKSIGPIRSFHVCFSRKWPDAGNLASHFNRELGEMWEEGKVNAILDRYSIIGTIE